MRKKNFLNQGAVTVEVQIQLKNTLSNNERKKAITNHPLSHAKLIISVMNLMLGNQIHTSNVDRRIISLQMVQNWKLWIIKLTGTRKILKLVRIY